MIPKHSGEFVSSFARFKTLTTLVTVACKRLYVCDLESCVSLHTERFCHPILRTSEAILELLQPSVKNADPTAKPSHNPLDYMFMQRRRLNLFKSSNVVKRDALDRAHEHFLKSQDTMDTMDSNLLISVIGGLGRWVDSDDGQQEYIKDDDCLGK